MYKIGFNVLKNDIAMEVKHQSCMNKNLKEMAGYIVFLQPWMVKDKA
jgi:hypothetical protein